MSAKASNISKDLVVASVIIIQRESMIDHRTCPDSQQIYHTSNMFMSL